MYFLEQGNVDDDATFLKIFLVSFNLQSYCLMQSVVCSLRSAICGLQSAVCSLQSAVCGLQSANVIHRPRQVRGHASLEILTFCSCKDVFFCILKLQTLSFNFHEKITFLDNLPVIWYQYPPHKLVHNLIETFQMLFYGAQFSLQCIMGQFLFLTQNKLGDFMVCDKVEIWR